MAGEQRRRKINYPKKVAYLRVSVGRMHFARTNYFLQTSDHNLTSLSSQKYLLVNDLVTLIANFLAVEINQFQGHC